METGELIDKFYKTFDIEPTVKKGEAYLDTNCRVAYVQAQSDIYPEFNIKRAWELEDMLLNLAFPTALIVGRDCGVWGYTIEQETGESYHHSFTVEPHTTRIEALMELCINMSQDQDVYDGVRDIFEQNRPKIKTTWTINPSVSISSIEATYNMIDGEVKYRPVDWTEYDEQEQ